MTLGVTEEQGLQIVEGTRAEPLMRFPEDARLVLEACFSARVRGALLYPENLTPRFFDLSSGEAGEVLDKLRRFQVRLAVVCAPGSVRFSSLKGAEIRCRVSRTRARHGGASPRAEA
jgi:hypothetical protein